MVSRDQGSARGWVVHAQNLATTDLLEPNKVTNQKLAILYINTPYYGECTNQNPNFVCCGV